MFRLRKFKLRHDLPEKAIGTGILSFRSATGGARVRVRGTDWVDRTDLAALGWPFRAGYEHRLLSGFDRP